MPDNVQTLLSTSCAGPLASTALTFCAVWGRWQVLIYLFRDERTDIRALTMDVTGRNIPPVTSSTVWLFVEAINTHVLPPQWDTAYLRDAMRQARMTGFYHFGSGRLPPPTQIVDALDFCRRTVDRVRKPNGNLAGKSCSAPAIRGFVRFWTIPTNTVR